MPSRNHRFPSNLLKKKHTDLYIPLTSFSVCSSCALETPNFTHTKQQVKLHLSVHANVYAFDSGLEAKFSVLSTCKFYLSCNLQAGRSDTGKPSELKLESVRWKTADFVGRVGNDRPYANTAVRALVTYRT